MKNVKFRHFLNFGMFEKIYSCVRRVRCFMNLHMYINAFLCGDLCNVRKIVVRFIHATYIVLKTYAYSHLYIKKRGYVPKIVYLCLRNFAHRFLADRTCHPGRHPDDPDDDPDDADLIIIVHG